MKLPAWLSRGWHMVLLVGVAVLLSALYMPDLCLSGFNSDAVIPAAFYRDLAQGGDARSWWWGGASFLFPDLIAYFAFHFALGNGLAALEMVCSLFFLGWLVAIILAYRSSGFPHSDVFAALAMLLAIGCIWNGMVRFGFAGAFFYSADHGGGYIATLGVLALIQRFWLHGWRHPAALLGMALPTFLACASDALILFVLAAPVVVALLLAAHRFPERAHRAWWLSIITGVSGIAGVLLGGAIFPPHVATASYGQFDLDRTWNSFCTLSDDFDFVNHAPLTVLSLADVVFLAFIARKLGTWFRASEQRDISPAIFLVLAYSAALIVFNWSSVVLTGNFLGAATTRYVALALLWPPVMLAGWAAANWTWPRWAAQTLTVLVAALGVTVALHPPRPDFYLTQKQQVVPALAALMQKEDAHAALGDYWLANMITEASDGATPVRELTRDGQMSHWFVDDRWYRVPPGFRLVLMQDYRPGMVRARFGDPQRIEKIGSMDAWVYAEGDSIHYIPEFDALGNRRCFPDSSTYSVSAAGIPHQTGVLEGDSLVARPGRDVEAMMADGPGFHVRPGHYRVAYTYAFLAPPQKGKEPIFDSTLIGSNSMTLLSKKPLTDKGAGTTCAVEEFVVPANARGQLQCRIQYCGSGVIQVDRQTISRLEP